MPDQETRVFVQRVLFSGAIYPFWGPLLLWVNSRLRLGGWPFRR